MRSSESRDNSGYLSLTGCLVLCLIAPLSGLAQAGLAPILPKISEHFASTPDAETLVRSMVSTLSFAMIAGSLGAGLLAKRMGQRPLLFLCLAVYAVAGAAGYIVDNLYVLVASRIILGVATAGWGVLIAAIITTQIAPEIRDRWLGFYIVSGTLGMFVLMVAIGALGNANWRLVFLLYLLALPLMLLLSFVVKPGIPAAETANREPVETARSRGSKTIPWGITLFSLACGAVGPTAMIFLPYHLVSIGEGSPDRVAGIIIATSIATGLVAFGYGWLRQRFSVVQIFVVGFALVALGLFLTVGWSSYMGAMVGLIIFGIGGGFLHPNLFAAAAASARPEDRPRALGFARAGVYAGPLVVQIPLEPVSHALGASAAIAGIAILAFVGLTWSLVGRSSFAPAT